MDVYKDFIQHLRRIYFDEVHILLCDVTPKLKEYVHLLTEVKFQDGSYHTFYGEVKRIIASFVNYFTQTVDDVIKEADKCSSVTTKHELMALVEQTISTHQSNQFEFGNEFLPITSSSEKNIYEEIEGQYIDYMKKMYEFREKLEKIQKQDKVDEFVKDHFEIAVKKTSEMFNFTYAYLAMMLAGSLNQTRTSLEEILRRMSNNLSEMQDECEESLNNLMHQLYNKNKESLSVCRDHRRRSVDMAEVGRGIELIKNKIENFETEVPLTRLEEEVTYWQERLKDFNEVAVNIDKIKVEQDNVAKQEHIYNSMRTIELPGSKRQCWENMGENFAEQRAYLKQKMTEEAKALVTFYACRGTDRILYTDNTGPYYVDELNHQIYVFDYGLGIYHINCEGKFKLPPDNEYYFDKYGRYIKQDGKKVYQCAPCASLYKLEDNDLLTKAVEDSKKTNKMEDDDVKEVNLGDLQGRREIKDSNDVTILPDFDHVDITNTLDKETVKYLWDSFGSILPDALHDVEKARSKNPIHFLAHKLLFHKYSKTLKELRQKRTEAEEFRANIFKERKEKAIAITKAWKAKQVQRRKPEESDDTQDRAVYDAQIAQNEFINSLNFYT